MISASEIHELRFEKAAFGYKQEDIDEFLNRLEQEVAAAQQELDDSHNKIQVLADKVREYMRDEDALKDALLGAQKCILQCVLVPHVLPNLIRQHLNLVVAVVQLLLCGSDLLFQAVQKFINVLLLISKSSLFEPKFVDFTCTNHLGSPLTDIFES